MKEKITVLKLKEPSFNTYKQHIVKMINTSLVSFFCLFSVSRAQQLAFPGAEGYGKYAKGGRDGPVYEITNLNDRGKGSLRAAVEASGPRTIVFRISGTIELESPLSIKNPYITIAGQTTQADTDHDGMPNDWEYANNLNKDDPNDRNIIGSDGFIQCCKNI